MAVVVVVAVVVAVVVVVVVVVVVRVVSVGIFSVLCRVPGMYGHLSRDYGKPWVIHC